MPKCIKCGEYTKFNGGLCLNATKKEVIIHLKNQIYLLM